MTWKCPNYKAAQPYYHPLCVFINNTWSWKSHGVHHPCDTSLVYCDWAEIINPHQLFKLSKSTCSWQWKSKPTTLHAIQAHRCDKSTSVTHNGAFTAIVEVWRPNASQCVAACKNTFFFYCLARRAGVLDRFGKSRLLKFRSIKTHCCWTDGKKTQHACIRVLYSCACWYVLKWSIEIFHFLSHRYKRFASDVNSTLLPITPQRLPQHTLFQAIWNTAWSHVPHAHRTS